MTSETPNEGVPGASSKLRRPHPPQALEAQEQVSAALDGLANGTAAQGSLEDHAKQDEVELDLGGVTRKMSRRELADTVKQVEEAQRLSTMAKAVLEKSGTVEHVARAYAGMDESEKRLLERALKDPKLLRRIEAVAASASQPDMFGEDPTPQDSALREEVAKLKELALRHNQALVSMGQERAQASLGQQVDAAMSQFDVFQDVPGLAEFAREHVLMQKALDPSADVGTLVMNAAKRQAGLIQMKAAERVEGLGRITNQRTAAPAPKFGAADVKSGKALAYLRKQVGLV